MIGRPPLLADQEHPLIEVDPLRPRELDIAEAYADGWEEGYLRAVEDRRWRVTGILLAALSGAILGAAAAIFWGALT